MKEDTIKKRASRDAYIIYLYVVKDKTQKQIGNALGISDSRVSQVLRENGIEEHKNKDSTKEYSRLDIIADFMRQYKENGEPPKAKEWDGGATLYRIRKLFGSYQNLRILAGVPGNSKSNRISDEKFVKCLREANDRVDGSMSIKDYDRIRSEDCPTSRAIQNRFGSWNEAKEKAGIAEMSKAGRKQEYTDEELVEKLAKAMAEKGKNISYREWDKEHSPPAAETISSRIGSWNEAKFRAFAKIKEYEED
jgi:hypothetical protein